MTGCRLLPTLITPRSAEHPASGNDRPHMRLLFTHPHYTPHYRFAKAIGTVGKGLNGTAALQRRS